MILRDFSIMNYLFINMYPLACNHIDHMTLRINKYDYLLQQKAA